MIVEALKTIRIVELGGDKNKIKKFAAEKLKEMADSGQPHLTSDDFLARFLAIQLWTNLEKEELKRLFSLLNRSQQQVPDRHLLEVTRSDLLQLFDSWGVPVITQRTEKEHPGHRGRQPKTVVQPHRYHFDNLINGALAYATHDQHTKTTRTLHHNDTEFNTYIDILEGKDCEIDFKWVCLDLDNCIQTLYSSKPGKLTRDILYGDTFFVPLMAAIGWARADPKAKSLVASHQDDLLAQLNASTSNDPLVLTDPKRGLNNMVGTGKGSIGKFRRNMIYHALKDYFRVGITDPDYPIDWQEGKKAAS